MRVQKKMLLVRLVLTLVVPWLQVPTIRTILGRISQNINAILHKTLLLQSTRVLNSGYQTLDKED